MSGGHAPPMRAEGTSMTDLHSLIQLSLLPSSCWRLAAERLRAGDSAADVAEQLIARRVDTACALREELDARAHAAVACAAAQHLTALRWSDPEYPPALATIF